MMYVQVDHAKDFIKHRILERIQDKQVPHQVRFSLELDDLNTVFAIYR